MSTDGVIVKERMDPFEHRFNPATGQNSLHATKAFKAGDTVYEFHALKTHQEPNMYTLQASAGEHIDLGPGILSYTNHSCKPTTFFNTTTRTIEALVDIQPGDQITFFYPSTEFSMESPFDCLCGELCCIGRMQGAKGTPQHVLEKYRLNDHIKELLSKAD
uniref:SET domain-containing protein n=1 Tax=Chlamydomonas leiostraca TaxID=1034604 RepID=A0A7S0RTD1_9CHLO|mmetsp:Transcript_3087/g.7743  ORF Transcript_3087/g.7743 Transcript_3087/m.7743 type:complete len:161 (+) Transcript_3087:105-587(+)|eukprot:CAMPEP_0202859098 /NCGR_PEP_ID=MMETSP1391-20130828/1367_1 /ASSEMBLY_ACC=CAM_ASM_000867 /TAXON_ID=1034604 /ORGANISM="Chlamydomonas leiostraca, Strain SAG 11-49" /LENGTH=160 /DNA_ID=CAMNT_0049538103 /DNA_START=103 /DNA_END=585 /DNA_ORIENTATION=+